MILLEKGKRTRALCCSCRRLYTPEERELAELLKKNRTPMCDVCFERVKTANAPLNRRRKAV